VFIHLCQSLVFKFNNLPGLLLAKLKAMLNMGMNEQIGEYLEGTANRDKIDNENRGDASPYDTGRYARNVMPEKGSIIAAYEVSEFKEYSTLKSDIYNFCLLRG